MTDPSLVEIGVVIVVALVFAVFDIFNKRNVPDVVVYAAVIIGIGITILYNYSIIWVDFGIAIIVSLIGFLIYRAGFLGGGDVLELVFISLVIPFQPTPIYWGIYQFGFPFVLSVAIAAGYTALIFMPLYYLLAKRIFAGNGLSSPRRRSMVLGAVLLIAYIAFAVLFYYVSNLSMAAVVLIFILALVSFISLIFEKDIYSGMTTMVYPNKLGGGDMIALNLMNKSDILYFKKRDDRFGRLVTSQTLRRLKGVRKMLPVYRDSVPFSLFILLGIIISLAIGNLILVIVGF